MIGIVLSFVGTALVIMIVFPIRVLLKVLRIATETELKLYKQHAKEEVLDQQIRSKELISTGYAQQAKNEERLLKAKITLMTLQIRVRLNTVKVLQWIVRIIYNFLMLFTSLSTLMVGVAIMAALFMSTQIPAWIILTQNQKTTKTVKKTTATNTNTTDNSNVEGALPNNAPNESVAVYIIMLGHKMPSNGAVGVVGNLMAETGGGEYKLHPEYDNQRQSGGMTVGGLGIIQWNGARADKIRARPDPHSIKTQTDFIFEELQGGYKAVYTVLMDPNVSIETATSKFNNNYEVSADSNSHRIGLANKFKAEWVDTGKYKQYMTTK